MASLKRKRSSEANPKWNAATTIPNSLYEDSTTQTPSTATQNLHFNNVTIPKPNSASHRVLNNYELLEQILIQVAGPELDWDKRELCKQDKAEALCKATGMRSVLVLQRVCKFWVGLILRSSTIQALLCFTTGHGNPVFFVCRKPENFNYILPDDLQIGFNVDIACAIAYLAAEMSGKNVDVRNPFGVRVECLCHAQASWRQTKVAFTFVVFHQPRFSSLSGKFWSGTLHELIEVFAHLSRVEPCAVTFGSQVVYFLLRVNLGKRLVPGNDLEMVPNREEHAYLASGTGI